MVSSAGAHNLSLAEVQALFQTHQGNCVPLFRTIAADILTPVLVYLKLTRGCTASAKGSFLLESVVQGAYQGRYSFIGRDPLGVLRTGEKEEALGDPLDHLQAVLDRYRPIAVDGAPPFTGGAVGFVGYDCARHFDAAALAGSQPVQDTLGLPESVFLICDTLVAFDHLHRTVHLVSHVFVPDAEQKSALAAGEIERQYEAAAARILQLEQLLTSSDTTQQPPQPTISASELAADAISNIGQQGYEAHVTRLKEHIVRGDIIQAVPSQRLSKPTSLHAFNAYRHLRRINPSPYMFYLDCGRTLQLVGASPECLCKVEQGTVYNHAIAGTVRRGANAEEDEQLAQELLSSAKDAAEHVMLVDLARNDVARVCEANTVQIDSLMNVERFSHVMHLTSQVSGRLRPDKTRWDAFRSIFPAGTVTGAPKIRAMQLIAELEGDKRGVYAGAVGRWNFSPRDMDTCIAIRTMVFHRGIVHLQAGGGIVFESDEHDEHLETLNKLGANLRVLREAEAQYAHE